MAVSEAEREQIVRDTLEMVARRVASARNSCLEAHKGHRKDGNEKLAYAMEIASDELDKIVFSCMTMRDVPRSRAKWEAMKGQTLDGYNSGQPLSVVTT